MLRLHKQLRLTHHEPALPVKELRVLIHRMFQRLSFRDDPADRYELFEMCLSGGGAALLPETAIFLHEKQDGLLKDVYVFSLLGAELETVIVYPSDRGLSYYEQVFVDACKYIFAAKKGHL